MKCLGRFQLKRAYFDGEHVQRFPFTRDFRQWLTNVAASDCSLAARIQHLREQFGGCRFPICSRYGDHRRFTEAPAEFERSEERRVGKECRSRWLLYY